MGVKTTIIYDNFWRKGTILTPSSEDSKHPASDTQIDTKEMYFKASSKTSPCNVPNNLGSAQEINFVAILDHNFESSDVTIKFQGADNSAFTVNLVTRILTYNATDIFAFVASLTKQYVRVRLEKATDFTDYPQFATVICGKYSEFNRRFKPGRQEGAEDFSEYEYSDSQVLFAQEKEILEITFYYFEGLNNTSKEIIKNLFNECGMHKAFIFCADYASPNSNSYWVRLNEIVFPTRRVDNYWSWDAPLIEVK